MALRFRKRNIKKTMYYVWFLGADESRGVRSSRYLMPVIDDMVDRESRTRSVRKVTLEVSHKGLKIVQNIFNEDEYAHDVVEIIQATSRSKVIKHLIPHNALTYVYQEYTIVAIIFVISTATSAILSKWPIYAHVYRCDCEDTAILLKSQLQKLIDKPDNQKIIAELESKILQNEKSGGDNGYNNNNNRPKSETLLHKEGDSSKKNIFDSLAEELKTKLAGVSHMPLLLPPRDYDTVHRQRGNFNNIDSRRCSNTNIVGSNLPTKYENKQSSQNLRRLTSSLESSGIGSDNSPSPQSCESFFNTSDDEEWNADTAESLIYLHHPQQKNSNQKPKKYYYHNSHPSEIVTPSTPSLQTIQPKIIDRSKKKPLFCEPENYPSPEFRTNKEYYDVVISPQDRFKDAKEKFEKLAKQQQLFKRPPPSLLHNSYLAYNNAMINRSTTDNSYRKSFYYNNYLNNENGENDERYRQRQRYSYAELPTSKYYYH